MKWLPHQRIDCYKHYFLSVSSSLLSYLNSPPKGQSWISFQAFCQSNQTSISNLIIVKTIFSQSILFLLSNSTHPNKFKVVFPFSASAIAIASASYRQLTHQNQCPLYLLKRNKNNAPANQTHVRLASLDSLNSFSRVVRYACHGEWSEWMSLGEWGATFDKDSVIFTPREEGHQTTHVHEEDSR